MHASFLIVIGFTVMTGYFSLHSPEVLAILFFTSFLLGLIFSFILAPPLLKMLVMLGCLIWAFRVCRIRSVPMDKRLQG